MDSEAHSSSARIEPRAISFRGHLPLRPGDPAIIDLPRYGMQCAIVCRDALAAASDWRESGVYVLMGRVRDMGYVGQAIGKQGLIGRLREQLGARSWWSHAVLVRDSGSGFTSGEVSYLEAALMARLVATGSVRCENKAQPFEHRFDSVQAEELDRTVDIIFSVLAMVGLDVGDLAGCASDESRLVASTSAPCAPAAGEASDLAHLLAAGVVEAGDELVCAWASPQEASTRTRALVSNEGTLICMGRSFDSLTAAASLLVGRETDGASFWGLVSEDGACTPLASLVCA
jgi:hypothetical protein